MKVWIVYPTLLIEISLLIMNAGEIKVNELKTVLLSQLILIYGHICYQNAVL